MFATSEVTCPFTSYGYIVPKLVVSAVNIDPYQNKALFALDALYSLFLLYPMYMELRDLIHAVRLTGLEGIQDYCGFWNAVDWISIIAGFCNTAIWCWCLTAMQADSIQALLDDSGDVRRLRPDIMTLDTRTLDAIKDDLSFISSLFRWLHCAVALNVMSIMMKFFKAFQANPRLQLVTNTLMGAASEIFHFSVVFFAIFVGFALTGHIMFGEDVQEFKDFATSFNTAFTVLMGDFAWYVEAANNEHALPSGVPFVLLAAWYWSYCIFVLLILLNMLLAIILDKYTELVGMVNQSADAPTLWRQVREHLSRARREKGHQKMEHLLFLMQDDRFPAHPQGKVTVQSLMDAFNMSLDQAKMLFGELQAEAGRRRRAEAGCDDDINISVKAIEGMCKSMADQMRLVRLQVAMCMNKIENLEEDFAAKAPKATNGDGKMAKESGALETANIDDSMLGQFSHQVEQNRQTSEDLSRLLTDLKRVAARLEPMAGESSAEGLVRARSGREIASCFAVTSTQDRSRV